MILVIDCGSSKTPSIAQMVNLFHSDVIVVTMDGLEQKRLGEASGMIISGAPILLTQSDISHYIKKFSFLKRIDCPVLGICFGHQIIGLVHGSEIFLGKPIRKSERMTFVEEDLIFSGIDQNPLFVEDHTEGINLPPNFLHLAKSENYKVEAMKHSSKTIYGVQFHPEVSGDNGKILMKNFLKMVK
jgi:GMP synthase (glutamine-hydrolysing)